MDVLLRLDATCNQSCYFCNVPTARNYTTAQAIKWIHNAKNVHVLSVTGGEPTLRKDIFEIIQAAKQSPNIKFVNIQTNATAASSPKFAHKLKTAGLDKAFVGFHSHHEKISNLLTKSTLWKKTVTGIQNLIAENIQVTLNPVVNKMTYEYLPEYFTFVSKKFPKLESISISFVQPHGRAWDYRKILVPQYSDVFPYLKKALQICDKHSLSYTNPYCGFPLCLFPGPKKRSLEFNDFVHSNSEKQAIQRVEHNKTHGPACKKCIYNTRCNGVWKKYADIHGLSELKPFTQT